MEVRHVKPGDVGRCSNCGKASLKNHLERYRGLCMDCFDEALIDEFGREVFDALIVASLKARSMEEYPVVKLDATREELEEMADAH